MCGRFSLAVDQKTLAETFTEFEIPAELGPRYNIAPSQPVAVVANNGQNKVEFFQWGLIPSWAKDPQIGQRMINARAETLAEKPSFKTAYKRRRCLVLADGFYEWRITPSSPPKGRGKGGAKTPMYIRLASGEPFAFAGLWESWRGAEDSTILSCTIITTTPNEFMAEIHNRMPVILPRSAYATWLDPVERNPDQLQELLKPYPAEQMTAYPVSRIVNSPQNDTPDCIIPVKGLI
jgi:putative SOS response-associated peptidase YedK